MKLIIAIVRPHTIDRIVCALEDIENFPGITVTDVEGFGEKLGTTNHDALNPFKLQKHIEIAANRRDGRADCGGNPRERPYGQKRRRDNCRRAD